MQMAISSKLATVNIRMMLMVAWLMESLENVESTCGNVVVLGAVV